VFIRYVAAFIINRSRWAYLACAHLIFTFTSAFSYEVDTAPVGSED
jgi:hypothetical protein